jgi:ADP-ribose pyrophosphatase
MKPDSVERVYDGSLIDLVVETWGENRREIVEHPGAVAVVPVDAEDRVVLVRQLREPARKHLLELPAGGLEPGEEPLASARRELREETGLHGGDWREAAAFWTTPGFCNEHMHLFVATGLAEGPAAGDDDEEIELVRWPVAEVAGRLGEIEDAKTLAGLLLYLRDRRIASL